MEFNMNNRIQLKKIAHSPSGFTLIEMLVVVAIMATLAAMLAPKLIDRAEGAKVTATKADIQRIAGLLEMYKLDNSIYPSADQGLKALVEKPFGTPEPRNWKQALNSEPRDQCGNDFYYVYPGEHGDFDVYSLGADGQPGGDEFDADIGNWDAN